MIVMIVQFKGIVAVLIGKSGARHFRKIYSKPRVMPPCIPTPKGMGFCGGNFYKYVIRRNKKKTKNRKKRKK